MDDDLIKSRQEINEIDQEMKELFLRRFACVKNIADYKKMNNLAIFDAKREQEIIDKLLKGIDDETLKPYYQKFIKEILHLSKEYQENLLEKK